ncbi:UNVERIFIED_CONTAM: hypothetical protein GTU68_052449 [Idotea baltica]|nr:hypothetical protein [Idotea baltica]
MKFATKVIHAGVKPDPSTGAIMTPIYQTSTYVQSAPGVHQGYEYARTQNPTRAALEENLAALENAKHAICYASGLAAMDAILKMYKPGDEIICTSDLYGGSYRLLTKIFGQFGLVGKFVDMTDVASLSSHITEATKLIWIETPTNPMLSIIDIKAACEIAHSHDIKVCVDNTFSSPYLQNPINLGADIVTHSATKYINGHSDVIHGVVITSDQEIADSLRFIQNAAGAVPGPMDCFLVLRGIKTLHLRVERSCQNAEKIAAFLDAHPKVSQVYYPGFESHPNHEIAKKQAAKNVLSGTHLFALAESLGGVESLIGHPASMTHASIPKEERMKVGLTDSLIRLSVGIEDVDDLIADLDTALALIN